MAAPVRYTPRRTVAPSLFSPFRFFEHDRNLADLVETAFAGLEPEPAGTWTPALTVEETDDTYIVETELPGIKRDDIKIELDESVLHVYGETTEVERKGEVRHQTRRTGKFDYRLSLPGDLDAEKVSADLADGVLTLTLAKAAPVKTRQIEINEG